MNMPAATMSHLPDSTPGMSDDHSIFTQVIFVMPIDLSTAVATSGPSPVIFPSAERNENGGSGLYASVTPELFALSKSPAASADVAQARPRKAKKPDYRSKADRFSAHC
jgi:hypothetical protein